MMQSGLAQSPQFLLHFDVLDTLMKLCAVLNEAAGF